MIRRLFCTAVLLLCFVICERATAEAAYGTNETLKVALSNDTYPYMFVDEQGRPDGLLVDYWREIARQQQFNIEFVMAEWPETVALLNAGKVDLHGGMAYTEQRAKDYNLYDINITIFSNVFVHRDLLRVETLQNLMPFAIGVVENSSHVATLNQRLPGALLRQYQTVTQMYDEALAGNLKAFASLDRLSPRYAAYQDLNNQFPLYKKLPLQAIKLVFGVPLNSPLNDRLESYAAAVSAATLNELERKWLGFKVDNDDTLLLGLSVLNQPFMDVSSQGEATGLLVDLWRLWSEKTGTSIAFVPDNSGDSLASLVNQRIDAHIGFPDIENMSPQLIKAYHLYSFSTAFYRLKNSSISALDSNFSGNIGIFNNANYLPELQRQYPGATFKRYPSLESLTQASIDGEIAGFFGAEVIAQNRLQQLNLASDFDVMPASRIFAPLYAFTHIENTELAEKIREGFNQFSLAELIAIEKKWVSSPEQSYFADFSNKIPLTPEERDWLAAHTPLRVGIISNWPPMEFVDEDGNVAGVSQEILSILATRLNIQFELQPYDEFEQILIDLEQRNIDLVANVSPLAEREAYARFTEPFWSVKWAVISHINSENVTSASDLRTKRIAIFRDYQLAEHLPDIVPGVEVITISDLQDGLRLLQANRVDYVLDSVEAGSRALKRSNAINLRMQLIDDLPDYPSLVAVRSDYQPLVAILNKGLRSIGETERTQIYQRWFDFEITQGIDRKRVYQIVWQVVAVTLVLIAVFIVWNLFLRREVNLRREAEHKMRYMATHDDLTGLPNRSLLKERIDQALEQHSRHNEILAVLFLDLDGFKEVNDIHGHDAGDELLLKLAGVLEGCIRKSDTVARFGGDEFVILLTALLHRDDAAIVAEKILYKLGQPLQLSFGEVQVGASIGIAIYPHDATNSSALLKQADKQMYLAKQQGKNGYSFTEREFS
ncbi:transporter substrate-binding domain-containing protein [Arsukibacterium indicum]|uniref:Transporter substrate-binding domain-containing protein n=1 Tax=Arsukibacterium indicum TaxID=2848612 RepID=A0ABS6MKA5_9GAMM|nr:transporter substrate-binding domain-containing protein [Arsukibacterium indicum]MBV2128657.1 transporter substrate-binding domain-containing protein [Arsukibacterium indicum]